MTPPLDEDRHSASLDLEDEVALCERQAHAELLDRAAHCCSLAQATVEAPTLNMGKESPFTTLARSPINMALPWGKSVAQILELNHDYISANTIRPINL